MALASVAGVASWLHFNSTEAPPFAAPKPEESARDLPVKQHAAPQAPETEFARAFETAAGEAEKLRLLDTLKESSWAQASAPVLIDCVKRNESPALRTKAFDVALELASRPQDGKKTDVLKAGLASGFADMRVRSLRECRADPRDELTDELIRAAQMGGTERFLAVHALAALDEPRAQRCVLDAAKDEDLPKAERARAIALLARSKLPEASEYLKELAANNQSEFSSIALDALAAIQANQHRQK